MIRVLYALLALALPLALSGCPTPNDDDSSAGDDDAGDDDAVDDDDTTEPLGPDVSGTVEDPSGTGLEGIALTLCDAARCISKVTGPEGAFRFEGLPEGAYVIHNIGVPGIADGAEALLSWSSFYDIVQVAQDDVVLANPLVIPEVSETFEVADGANDLAFADGLAVSWDGTMDVPPALNGVSPLTVGAVLLPPAWYPAAAAGREVLAGWALTPFELALEEDGAFAISAPAAGLSAGDSVSLLFADYDTDIGTGALSESAASVSADGLAVEGAVSHLGLLLAVRD